MRSSALLPPTGLLPVCLLLSTGWLAVGCNGNDDGTDVTDDTDIVYATGCIEVSSADQGFAFLEDALDQAEDGATIELCEDIDKTLTIDKPLTIIGNGVVLTPAVNSPAIVVTADGDLTVSGLSIQSTRSGIIVEAGTRLNISGVQFAAAANYGIDVAAGAVVVADEISMTAPAWGGVKVAGGTLTLTNSEIVGASAYGVFADDASTITVENTVINGVLARDTSQPLFDVDGIGIWLEGRSTATLANNTITNAQVAAISADGGSTVSLDGDTFAGGFAGLTLRQSGITASGLTTQDYNLYGLVCVSCTEVTLDSVSFTTSPETSRPSTAGQEGGSQGSIGVYGIESEVVITGTPELPSEFRGHNTAGILVNIGGGGSVSKLDLSNAIVDGNYGLGIGVYNGEVNLVDVDITNTYNDDENCITDTGYSCNMAAALFSSSGSVKNTTVTDSNDWGLTMVNGVLDVEGGSFARNQRNSIFAQAGSLSVAGTAFSEARATHLTIQQGSAASIDNCTFTDGAYTIENEFDNGAGEVTLTRSYFQAQEILISDGDATISNSTFTNGERGITVFGNEADPAEVDITNTTFTDYNAQVLYAASNSELSATDVSLTNVGRWGAYCYNCVMDLENVRFENFTTYKYKYEYFVDGELLFDNEFERSDTVLYTSIGQVSLDNVVFDGLNGRAMFSSSSTIEMDDVTLKNVLRDSTDRAALELTWARRVIDDVVQPTSFPTAILNDLTIEGQVGSVDSETGEPAIAQDAILMSAWRDPETGALAEGLVELVDINIASSEDGNVTGDAVDLSLLDDVTITGLDVSGTRGSALRLSQTNVSVTGAAAGRTGTIDTTGAPGVVIDADLGESLSTSVTLADLTISGATGDGITVNAGNHTFSNVSVTSATGWGATCVNATFDSCNASLSGDLGAQSGCDACSAR
ncbi:MAG: right-handed parallel beta-helix repeat-containing protein [Myxococcota bacterium]